MTPACIIGISGYSDSGKTTLIEEALTELKREGLSVGILKHSHHRLTFDRDEKDTDRFYRAGADYVFAHNANESFGRHRLKKADLIDILAQFPRELDLVIVEGYKNTPVSRVWVTTRKIESKNKSDVSLTLYRDDRRSLEKLVGYVYAELNHFHEQRPLHAGILVGGRSRRMGRPKALLEMEGETLVEKAFAVFHRSASKTVLLGMTELPPSLNHAERLPDIDGVEGPMSGMLSAFRWSPESAWIVSAVDMPFMDREAWKWIVSKRKPGVWAVMPRFKEDKGIEGTFACYEPMIFGYIESLARKGIFKLQEIARHPKVIKPIIPVGLSYAWENVNTEKEWIRILRRSGMS